MICKHTRTDFPSEICFLFNKKHRSELERWLIESPERCTKQFAPIAVRNAKSHSNLTQVVQFTAVTAGPRDAEATEEDIETVFLESTAN